MLHFDPRHHLDREVDINQSRQHIQSLATIFPQTGMTTVWDISYPVPDFIVEEEVTTSLSAEERVAHLLLAVNLVSTDILDQPLDEATVQFIERSTVRQAECSLWHELRKCRITSSNFGSIYRAIHAPSLVKLILENK